MANRIPWSAGQLGISNVVETRRGSAISVVEFPEGKWEVTKPDLPT